MTRIRVLLADDHGIVRQGLRAVLGRDPRIEVAGESADGLETVSLAEALAPDIVIVDITMPHLNGIDATAQIVQRNPETGVIILSMHSDETYVLRALKAGARGYLLKDSAEVDLIRAVCLVAEGKTFFSPAVTVTVLDDHTRSLQQRHLTDSLDILTGREKEVLQLVAEGKSNKEVAARLEISHHTVESHRNNLMQKLSLHNTAEIVLYAVRRRLIQ